MTSLRVFAGIAVFVAFAGPVRADGEFKLLLEKQAPAIVSVRTSLKSSVKGGAPGQDTDNPMTMQGVVVSRTGLIMVSNLAFSPTRAMEIMGAGRGGADASSTKVTPTNIKVHFADDEKDYDGFLAATDTPLDLAFIQVEGLGGKRVPFVDFASAGTAGLGQTIFGVARLQKGYDYAPYVQTSRVIGEIAKPRKGLMLEGHISNLGLPVFNSAGQPVGALTTLVGVTDEAGSAELSLGVFMRMVTGGGNAGGAFVLPSKVVKGLVDLATKRASVLAVERAKKKTEAPKAEVKTPSAKPPAAKPPKKPGMP